MSDMYNPQGSQKAESMTLPLGDGSVDRVVLHSVFTHMFRDPIAHYMREIRRCSADSVSSWPRSSSSTTTRPSPPVRDP